MSREKIFYVVAVLVIAFCAVAFYGKWSTRDKRGGTLLRTVIGGYECYKNLEVIEDKSEETT